MGAPPIALPCRESLHLPKSPPDPIGNRFLDLLRSKREISLIVAHRGDSFRAGEHTRSRLAGLGSRGRRLGA